MASPLQVVVCDDKQEPLQLPVFPVELHNYMQGFVGVGHHTIRDIVTTLADNFEHRLPSGTAHERKAMFHEIKLQMRLKYPKCRFEGVKVVS